MKMRTVKFRDKEYNYILLRHVKEISKYGDGTTLDLNLIIWDNDDPSWNTEGEFVYDVRLWNSDHTRCYTGLKLWKYQMKDLVNAFNSVRDFEIDDEW